MGQHFLTHPGTIHRIVVAANVTPRDLVVEIGPGRGALTQPLLELAKRLVGIELDRSLCLMLSQNMEGSSRFRLINADVLEVDLVSVVREEGFDHAVLVGNLPYQISGAVINKILDAREAYTQAVLMVQKEVAARMTASPGVKDYGILSLAVQIASKPEMLFDVEPDHFVPVPKVHSCVVKLNFNENSTVQIQDVPLFFRIARTVFQQRRKMLRNSLRPLVSSLSVLDEVLLVANIDSSLRPEALSVDQFASLCQAMHTLKAKKGNS